jgi:hypothetical protein
MAKTEIRGDKIVRHVGKGSHEEKLPSRFAMAQLTNGDVVQRSYNNYAKKTPAGMTTAGPNVFMMGRRF